MDTKEIKPAIFNPQTNFLDPGKTLFATGLSSGMKVADLGAGAGFYAIAASKILGPQGEVYVVDILESALSRLQSEARAKGLRNIKTLRCDLEAPDACMNIPKGEVDLVIMANVLHQIKNKNNLFIEAYKLLKTGGKLLVIDWNSTASPIGPEHGSRVSEEEMKKLGEAAAMRFIGEVKTDKYHYGLVFVK